LKENPVTLTQSDVTEVLDAGSGLSVDTFAPSLAGDRRIRGLIGRFESMAGTPARDEAPDRDESADRHPSRASCDFGTNAGDPLPRRADRAGRARALLRPTDPGRQMRRVPGEDHWWWTGDDSDAIPQEIEEFLTGQRHDAEIGRVLKTILFTDIVWVHGAGRGGR
jgi:hypothetical protein